MGDVRRRTPMNVASNMVVTTTNAVVPIPSKLEKDNYFNTITRLLEKHKHLRLAFLRYEKTIAISSLVIAVVALALVFTYLAFAITYDARAVGGWLTWTGPSTYDHSLHIFTNEVQTLTNTPYKFWWLVTCYGSLIALFCTVAIYIGWKTMTSKVCCSIEGVDSAADEEEVQKEPLNKDMDAMYYYEILFLGVDKTFWAGNIFIKSFIIWIIGSAIGITDIIQLVGLLVVNLGFEIALFTHEWTNTGSSEVLRFDRDSYKKNIVSTTTGTNNLEVASTSKQDPGTYEEIKQNTKVLWIPFIAALFFLAFVLSVLMLNVSIAYQRNGGVLPWFVWAITFAYVLECLLQTLLAWLKFYMLDEEKDNMLGVLRSRPHGIKIDEIKNKYRIIAIKYNGNYKLVGLIMHSFLDLGILLVFFVATFYDF
jgi:hypothetical protein